MMKKMTEGMEHEKVVERADGQPLESFCIIIKHLIVADQCCGCLLLADFAIFLIMIMVIILPYFRFQSSNFYWRSRNSLPDTVYDVVAKIVSEFLTSTINWFAEFSRFICTWTFSEINGFPPKPLTKPKGDQSRGIISHQLMSLLVSFGLQILCLLPLFLSMFGRTCCSTSSKLTGNQTVRYFSYLQDFTGPLVYFDPCHLVTTIFLPKVSTTNPLCFTREVSVLLTLIFYWISFAPR